ncbi:MAG: 4'-phosphopantetheinyl transferase superfamily protein [Planctomycetota bacterium]
MTSLFPPEVIVEEADPREVQGELDPREEGIVARAVARRRRQFLAGRVCARRALSRLGVEGWVLAADSDRVPVWPAGIVGSIAHTDRYCVAAVARSERFAGIGVDAELIHRAKKELWRRICTAEELAVISELEESKRALSVALAFSAKECFYKCQFPLTRSWLGFHDVVIHASLETGLFEVEVVGVGEARGRLAASRAATLVAGARFEGRYVVRDEHVLTGMVMPA